MATTSNYNYGNITRKVDLYTMGPMDFSLSSRQRVTPSMGIEHGGDACAGITKLSQRIMMILLNGPVPFDVEYGTSLIYMIQGLSLSNAYLRLQTVLPMLLASVKGQITKELGPGTPLDEYPTEIEVLRLDVIKATSTISVVLMVTTAEYRTAQVVVPVPIVP